MKDVFVEPSVKAYIAQITAATRRHEHLSLGASPRGSVALMRASQAMALLRGMSFVDPSLVKAVTQPVLGHRLIVKPQSQLGGRSAEAVLDEILEGMCTPVYCS